MVKFSGKVIKLNGDGFRCFATVECAVEFLMNRLFFNESLVSFNLTNVFSFASRFRVQTEHTFCIRNETEFALKCVVTLCPFALIFSFQMKWETFSVVLWTLANDSEKKKKVVNFFWCFERQIQIVSWVDAYKVSAQVFLKIKFIANF